MKRMKIGDLCELQNGRAFSQDEWQDHGHPIIRIQNLSDPRKGFNYAANGYPKQFWVDTGDILFSWSGTPGTSFGCFRWSRQPGWLNQHIFNMRLKNPEQTDGDYFIRAINGVMREIIDQAHGGVGLKHITKAKLLNVEVPFPSLQEQKRIAKILDAADALRAKRRESLAQLDALLQSTFLNLFGDPVLNPFGFVTKPLGNVCDVRDGTHDSPRYVSEGFPLLTSKNFKSGEIDFDSANLISETDYCKINQRSKVDVGDLVMPMIGTIGHPVLVENEPNFAIKNVALIKFKSCSPNNRFIEALLSSHYFDHITSKANRGGTQKFVSLGDLRKLPIPLPSISLQEKYASLVAAVKKQKVLVLSHLMSLDKLFAVLQQKAFSGEL